MKKLKEIYRQHKPYIRVDLIMYLVMISCIIIYFIVMIVKD